MRLALALGIAAVLLVPAAAAYFPAPKGCTGTWGPGLKHYCSFDCDTTHIYGAWGASGGFHVEGRSDGPAAFTVTATCGETVPQVQAPYRFSCSAASTTDAAWCWDSGGSWTSPAGLLDGRCHVQGTGSGTFRCWVL